MLKTLIRAELTVEIISEIGQEGKNSKVYLVRDRQINAEMVMKTIQKEKIDDPGQYFNEARILHLSSHSNVVPIQYACEDDDAIHITMPHYKNGSLKKRIQDQFLTVREIIRYSSQFMSGLHNIHSKGLVHFDVKPDNILLSNRDEAMVADFGLARQINHLGLAEQDQFYLKMRPPEAFLGDQFSRSFDIYQAGLTLYRMANGDDKFEKQLESYIVAATISKQEKFDLQTFREDVLRERFPSRNAYLPHIPTRLRMIINKCLKADPAQRYASTIEIINDLATLDGIDLDWRYQHKADVKNWVKIKDGTVYSLSIHGNGAATAEKKVGSSASRKIPNYCKASLSESEIKNFLKAY